jgi:cell division protease FtsH
VLDNLVLELLEKETLAKAQLTDIFANVIKRPARPVWLSSERRHVSDMPPVMTPAEHAAMTGQTGPQDRTDTVISEGPPPTTVIEIDEHTDTVVIERPEDGHFDPSSD